MHILDIIYDLVAIVLKLNVEKLSKAIMALDDDTTIIIDHSGRPCAMRLTDIFPYSDEEGGFVGYFPTAEDRAVTLQDISDIPTDAALVEVSLSVDSEWTVDVICDDDEVHFFVSFTGYPGARRFAEKLAKDLGVELLDTYYRVN